MTYYVGLDLGGTNIKAGVVDGAGRVVVKESTATKSQASAGEIVGQMIEAARGVVEQAGMRMEEVAGIGIGSPGPIDFERGVPEAAPNLPQLKGVEMPRLVREATGRPVVLENDANAAAFAEFWVGAGRDETIRHLVLLTLGTGIGSGVIVDGQVLHGGHGWAGEAGHMIVVPGGRPCSCGQLGCVEAYGSASNTAKRAVEAIGAGRPSALAKRLAPGEKGIDAKDVFEAAKEGDGLAQQIVEETAEYLGIACVSLCRILDPQMIVFAGGMIQAGEYLFARVRAAYARQTWRMTADRVVIVPSPLGNDAGLIGAAGVAWDAERKGRLGRVD